MYWDNVSSEYNSPYPHIKKVITWREKRVLDWNLFGEIVSSKESN